MRKVLFVASEIFSTGGIQRFNRNLLNAWKSSEVGLTVISLNDDPADIGSLAEYSDIDFVFCGRNKTLFCIKFLKLVFFNHFDRIVCGHINLSPLFIPVHCLTKNRNNTVLILHGVDVWGRVKGLIKYSTSRFSSVLAVSSYTLNEYFRQHNSVDPAVGKIFPNTLSHKIDVQGSGKEKENFTIISVARLDKTEYEKGIYHVLDALQLMHDLDFTYMIVGDGDDRENICQYTKDLGLEGKVELKGRLSDEGLWRSYKNADVFILPSRKEGFGIVFLEAMSHSLPVIAAAEKGALDVIENGKTGVLVEYGNIKQIEKALRDLYEAPSLRNTLVQNSKELINEGGKFSFEAFSKRTKEFLC